MAAVLSISRPPGSRRRRAALARWRLLLLALAAVLPPGAAVATTAVILNSDDDSLSIIDGASYRETSRYHIGRAPHHLILTPDNGDLIVALATGNELAFIERRSGMVRQRLAISDPYHLGFSPDGKWFVTCSLRLARIDVYDAASYRLVHRLPAWSMPSHMGFAPDGSAVYITLQGSNALIAIELASGRMLWTVTIGRQPAGVAVRPSGTILAAIMGSDHFVEVDPRDGTILRRVQTARGTHNFLVSPDGKTLYVSNRVAGSISVLNAETLAITGTILAPGGPDDMALSSDGSELWVTGRFRHLVNVIDLPSGILKATVPVGRSPHGIFLY